MLARWRSAVPPRAHLQREFTPPDFGREYFAQVMQLTINGDARTIPDATTVAELLARLGLDPRTVVVELNRKIIRRTAVASAPVADGDVVEIVHFVGGG